MPDPVEVAGSGLVPQRWLSWTCSCGGRWLGPATVQVAGSGVALFITPESCKGIFNEFGL